MSEAAHTKEQTKTTNEKDNRRQVMDRKQAVENRKKIELRGR